MIKAPARVDIQQRRRIVPDSKWGGSACWLGVVAFGFVEGCEPWSNKECCHRGELRQWSK